jgi:hypothetical protein
MDFDQLKHVADQEGIVCRAYSLEAGRVDNQYVLGRDGGLWTVYYFERGERWDVSHFLSEDEACTFLLDELRKDPTTRRR